MLISPEIPIPSVAYFILHQTKDAYSEIGVDAEGMLFIRQTKMGKVVSIIPLGSANVETVELLQQRLDEVADFFQPYTDT